ncbi:AI-2E family transporter [Pseudomethylobacillus aquaticus]|uniref:AI-2E family transporter n=1 Tax=Pseudomethylobacillus aquaticus TaxID=2676064 RepID=A0A3N0UZQ0_9PROT|nr:AI-2E family transporter [Pseudomethylobacillus aquaticus]ROH85842.1 AI-2E family transporter [Pseudomethylobacillus aquaticus]
MTSKRENLLPDYRIIVLTAAFMLLMYLLLPVMAPFLVAAILAYICNPLVDRLSHLRLGTRGLGRTTATLLVLLLLVGVLILLVLVIVPLLQRELLVVIQRLPNYISAARDRLEPLLMQYFGVALDINVAQIQEILTKHWQSASGVVGKVLATVSTHGMAIIGWLVNLALVPVVLFYLLRDWHGLIGRIAHLLPRRWVGKTNIIAHEIDLVLAEFLRGQLSVMVMMSLFYAIALWAVGLELALPVALIAGLLGFVPYLGVAIGLSLAVLAAALQFSSLAEVIPVLLVFGLAQLLEGMLLTPWLVGDRIGLHPVAVIFALLAGGELFGFSGILLALPVSAAIAVGLRHAKHSYLASDTYLKQP